MPDRKQFSVIYSAENEFFSYFAVSFHDNLHLLWNPYPIGFGISARALNGALVVWREWENEKGKKEKGEREREWERKGWERRGEYAH